ADLAEVERARRERADPPPVRAGIVAPEHAARATRLLEVGEPPALVGLDDRVDDVGRLRVDREADAAGALRQAIETLRPVRAAVLGAEDAAGLRDAGVGPRRPPPRVERGVEP